MEKEKITIEPDMDHIDIELQNVFQCRRDLFQKKEWGWMRTAYQAGLNSKAKPLMMISEKDLADLFAANKLLQDTMPVYQKVIAINKTLLLIIQKLRS